MSEFDAVLPHGMHVVHDGPEQGPPLLLIHGSGAAGATRVPMLHGRAAPHPLNRLDGPGCGHGPPPAAYDLARAAGQIAALLDDLGLRQVAVAGHSSGGYVATALTEGRPDLVSSLALISTGPSLDALLPQPAILRLLLGPPFGPLLWSLRSDAAIRSGIRATTVRQTDIPDDLVAGVRGTTYRTFRAVSRCNIAYLDEGNMPERLAALKVPLLVVFGDADPRWEPSSAHRYEAVPDSRVELLPGIGHIPLLEAPEATSDLLLRFAGRP
ncbi:alpha/beta fold hydrolase [Streptomyces sp. NPDC050256]|uniref:alpha/beta fold hydrolase n=1 Tax=Streptomyces sp. NPDC050256 TaxID=3365607 RepID=UPI00379B212C